MEHSSSRHETTLAVIIGASDFPEIQELDYSPSFKASAGAVKRYLLDRDGLGLPAENLLDMFDSEDPQSQINKSIASFIRDRIAQANDSTNPVQDILIYYVGHGGFTDDGQHDYFLTVRDTSDDHSRSSGLLIQSLATTLKRNARHLRKYLILDCCFSAAAYSSFMAAPLQAATQKTIASMPTAPGKGTSMLCAASSDDPAINLADQEYTTFSTALLDVLLKGDSNHGELLTFRELGELCQHRIKEIYYDKATLPELHSPDQKDGDIADNGLLIPNAAKSLHVKQREIELLDNMVVQLTERVEILEGTNEKLEERLNTQTQHVTDLTATLSIQKDKHQKELEYVISRWSHIAKVLRERTTENGELSADDLSGLGLSSDAAVAVLRGFARIYHQDGFVFKGDSNHLVYTLKYSRMEALPIARIITTYEFGNDAFDDSFSIEDSSGEFLGEVGLGIADSIGRDVPNRVSALELWLFDKSDPKTKTKVLMSEYSYFSEVIRSRLTPRGLPILAKSNETIVLESHGLIINAKIVEMQYGSESDLPQNSFFKKLKVQISTWAKKK